MTSQEMFDSGYALLVYSPSRNQAWQHGSKVYSTSHIEPQQINGWTAAPLQAVIDKAIR